MKYLIICLSAIALFQSCSSKKKVSENTTSGDTFIVADDTLQGGENTVEEFYTEGYKRNYDHIYKDNIKTARLFVDGYERSYPRIALNGSQRLKLSFDDLDADYKTYSFKIVHCNSDWEPSGLLPQQYIQGFENELIDRYKFSFNTIQSYTHYFTTFPNDYVSFKKTGNYLLHVFLNYSDEDIVLTKRFIVYEKKVEVEARVVRPTVVKNREYKQEVDFTVHHAGYSIDNPYGDLKVVLLKNHRWDNAITGLKPVFVKDNELVYDHQEKNVFFGGNEYRKLDLTSFRYRTEEIDKILEGNSLNEVWIKPDQARSYKQYLSNRDINGNYVINRKEGNNSAIEADYAKVHFSLEYETPLKDGSLYVFGRLSDWRFNENYKMHYDVDKKAYTTSAFLKQGYYNYNYAFLPDDSEEGDITRIEGTHFETENEYTIIVYHRPPGSEYDRVIGLQEFNSVR